MNTFVIVGAAELGKTILNIPENAFIIAADGGLAHLQAAGLEPDLILGDFDSLGHIPKGENVIAHQPEKDDTDTMLAIKEALKRGADTIIIYGGLGGRFDHSIANLQALTYISLHSARGYLIGDGSICTVTTDGGLEFSPDHSGFISVFCQGDRAEGVTIKGLKYPLTNHTLTLDLPLGVSNEFLGLPASIEVKQGTLAIIWQCNSFHSQKYNVI